MLFRSVICAIGCGKGRLVCWFARQPVSRVIGIDLDPELTAAAEANSKTLRRRRALVEIRTEDATVSDFDSVNVFRDKRPTSERLVAGSRLCLSSNRWHGIQSCCAGSACPPKPKRNAERCFPRKCDPPISESGRTGLPPRHLPERLLDRGFDNYSPGRHRSREAYELWLDRQSLSATSRSREETTPTTDVTSRRYQLGSD